MNYSDENMCISKRNKTNSAEDLAGPTCCFCGSKSLSKDADEQLSGDEYKTVFFVLSAFIYS